MPQKNPTFVGWVANKVILKYLVPGGEEEEGEGGGREEEEGAGGEGRTVICGQEQPYLRNRNECLYDEMFRHNSHPLPNTPPSKVTYIVFSGSVVVFKTKAICDGGAPVQTLF